MRKDIVDNIKYCDSYDNEDRPVIDFFCGLNSSLHYNYIEIGSGLCRFPKKIKDIFHNFDISCFEINEKSALIAETNGFKTIIGNVLKNDIKSESYDIVHCSHIIEHFKYPDVIKFVDEMLRITKCGGYLIIRSPLMWEHFYDDIDHIRPYPPEAILNYLYNPQQQSVGHNNVRVEKIWYRTRPKHFLYMNDLSPFHSLKLIRGCYNRWIHFWNKRMHNWWKKYRWPATPPNGYVMIMKKES